MMLKGILFDDLTVDLDDRVIECGGSFWYRYPTRAYDPVVLKWAYTQLKSQEHPVLFDIGASTGCYSLLKKYIPRMAVYAFEPAHETRAVLEANLNINQVYNRHMHVFRFAMSDYSGEGTLHLVDLPHVAVSMLDGVPSLDKSYEDITVEVAKIDSIVYLYGQFPTLIKIDTEGNELAVLRGGEKTIKEYKPLLLVEYSAINTAQYNYHPHEIVDLLEAWGYKIEFSEDQNNLYGYPQG